VPQSFAQLFAKHAVTTRLRGLAAQTVYLPIDLGDDVEMRERLERADSSRASVARCARETS
jgi:hypothetical protein